jgi:DNA-binding NarL/FixJ family response regulator
VDTTEDRHERSAVLHCGVAMEWRKKLSRNATPSGRYEPCDGRGVWQRPVVVAVLDTNDDLLELMRISFERAGFVVVSGHIDDLRRGILDLPSFIRQHDPRVIVYDIPPPYPPHWRFLEHIRLSPDMQGREFVLTCTNVQRLRDVLGINEVIYELVGLPDDLERIQQAVKMASRTRSFGPPQHPPGHLSSSTQSEAHDQQSPRRTYTKGRSETQRSVSRKRRPPK